MKRTGSYKLPSVPVAVELRPKAVLTSATTGQLQLKPLNGKEHVKQFLDAIRKDFIDKADILESGLQDHLVQSGVLTQQDSESLQAGHLPTRGEKTRHLWKLLSSIDHEVVAGEVAPILAKLFAHIIPERFWVLPEQPHTSGECGSLGGDDNYPKCCTRCSMQARVRPTDLADFLFEIEAINLELYNDLTTNQRLRHTDWPKLFSAFTVLPPPAAQRHSGAMTSLLQRHSLSVPSDLVDLMTEGFPCTCPLVSGQDLMLNTLGRRHSRRSSDASSAGGLSISSASPMKGAQEAKELSDLRKVLWRLDTSTPTSTLQLSSCAKTLRNRRASRKRTSMKANTWDGPRRPQRQNLQPEGDSAEGDSAETRSPSRHETGSQLSLANIVLKEIDEAGNLVDSEITRVTSQVGGHDAVSATTPGIPETPMKESQVALTSAMAGLGLPSGTSDTASPHTHRVFRPGYVASVISTFDMNADSTDVHTDTAYAGATEAACSSPVVQNPKHSTGLRNDARAFDTVDATTTADAVTAHPHVDSDVNTHAKADAAQKQTEDADMMAVASSDSSQNPTDSVNMQTQAQSAATSDSLDVVGLKQLPDPASARKSSDSDGLVDLEAQSDAVAEHPRSVESCEWEPVFVERHDRKPAAVVRYDWDPEFVERYDWETADVERAEWEPAVVAKHEWEPAVVKIYKLELKVRVPIRSSRQGSMYNTSLPLESPVKLLPAGSSSDDDKYNEFVEATHKINFGKQRPNLLEAIGHDRDDARTHNAQVDPLRPSQSAEDADSPGYELSDPDDFTSHAVEHAIQNSDVARFLAIVANDVDTTEKLTRLFERAVISDTTATIEVQQLLENHGDIHSLYNEIVGGLQASIADMTEDMTPSASHGNDVLDAVIQLCYQIQTLCLDILLFTRVFLVCAIYLNSDVTTTSSLVRDTTDRFIRDVMVLQQVTRREAWRGVQRLRELTNELQGGVASGSTGLGQVIQLLNLFLMSS